MGSRISSSTATRRRRRSCGCDCGVPGHPDTLFPSATLQAAYDASLAGIPDGARKAAGIEVGTMAADAMLAEGHDGRVLISCTFGTFVPGVWQPLPTATGAPACDRARG